MQENGSNEKISIQWMDYQEFIEVVAPYEFSFKECLVYLDRSKLECLHRIINNEVYKALVFDETRVVIKISSSNNVIRATFLNMVPNEEVRKKTAYFIYEMFDLGTELIDFYKMAGSDEVLRVLVNKYFGLRIIKMSDIFEALCWAIMGQQINLSFAYTLKKRLVESYGEKLIFEGEDYYIFPTAQKISELGIEDLRALQFTSRKAEYIIGVGKLFSDNALSRQELNLERDYESLLKKLVSVRGIGNWTADYVIMKCFSFNSAFPIADVGVHNALKALLNMKEKPKLDHIQRLAMNWKGWESYATFYLWRSLYD